VAFMMVLGSPFGAADGAVCGSTCFMVEAQWSKVVLVEEDFRAWKMLTVALHVVEVWTKWEVVATKL